MCDQPNNKLTPHRFTYIPINFPKSIAALTSDTTNASLKVPDYYPGVGAKEGALVFRAEAE